MKRIFETLAIYSISLALSIITCAISIPLFYIGLTEYNFPVFFIGIMGFMATMAYPIAWKFFLDENKSENKVK